jgi:hypothetical protein
VAVSDLSMRPLRRSGGDDVALTHYPVTLEISGTIQTSFCHNHRCVFWKPKILRSQDTAVSLGVIYKIWLPTCFSKALLGGGRESGVPSGSISVISMNRDESSALWYFRKKNAKLVDVMIFCCLTQVGRKCEDSTVFWNHYEVTSKFVCDVLTWNQEYICEIAPEALVFF